MTGKKVIIAILVVVAIGAIGRELYVIYKDNRAFDEAVATNTPSSYSDYLANPGARHREEARGLYSKAFVPVRERIREKPCHAGTQGGGLLLQMANFADKSGQDGVAVVINRVLDFPKDETANAGSKDETVPLANGKAEKIVSASEYFEFVPRQDQYFPYRVVEGFDDKLKGAFNFLITNADPRQIVLQVDYRVGPTGDMYKVKRAKKSDDDSDVTLLYYGLKYDWKIQVLVPGLPPNHFEFTTEPAADFGVHYRSLGDSFPSSPNDMEVYGAMENSAMEGFYKRLVEQLCAE